MSARRLPNFSALRAFEAAARHENFSRAAEELRLTHGAISHQVKALEEELGRPLFVRHGRQVKITHEAQQFARFLGKTFDEVANAADAMRAEASNQRLVISAPPWFAARWLSARLGAFIELRPDIEVVLDAGSGAREGIDVAVRFDAGRHPGMVTERLMDEVSYVVVSPHYRQGALPVSLADLDGMTLLGGNARWERWLKGAEGLSNAPPEMPFEDLAAVIRAAIDGEGVALLRHVVAAPEIAAGRLVRLFDISVPCAEAYHLVMPARIADKPRVAAFRRWLADEVAAFQRQQT